MTAVLLLLIAAGTYRLDCNQVLLRVMVSFIIAVNVHNAVN